LDSDFNPGTGVSGAALASVKTIAVQNDGKVLIGGSFTSFAGMPRPGIARLVGDAVLIAPQLLSPIHSNGVFSVSLPTVTGETYSLEFKDSLTADTWTALPAVSGTGTLTNLLDRSATGPGRVYRVRVE
jgi:hypothetical protein